MINIININFEFGKLATKWSQFNCFNFSILFAVLLTKFLIKNKF